MTVCVAAFAAECEAIVMISDKAVTLGSLTSDTTICKMSRIGETKWYALIAGEIPTADKMLLHCETKLATAPQNADTLLDMMTLTARAYQEVYDAHLEARVLAPKLLNRASVYQRSKELLPLTDKLNEEIEQDRQQFEREWSCELLICGFDAKDHCHIFRVIGGHAIQEDRSGYSAVGIGADAACGRLMFLDCDRNDGLAKVIWDAFDAKVQGEQMLGVGYKWDAHIVLKSDPTKIVEVPEHLHDLMDLVMNYLNVSQFDFEPWKPDEIPPDNWKDRITEFANCLIAPAPPTA